MHPSDPTKTKIYWMRAIRTLYLDGLNIESDLEVVFLDWYILLLKCQGTCLINYYRIFWVLFIWQNIFTTRFPYNSSDLIICSELGLGPLKAPTERSFEKTFRSFTCYLLSQEVTCYMLSGFHDSSLISIHKNISK